MSRWLVLCIACSSLLLSIASVSLAETSAETPSKEKTDSTDVEASASDIDVSKIIPEEDGEFSAFDFYVGGRYYGLAYGFFGEGWFSFDVPEDVLELLPDTKDNAAFLPLLEGVITGTRVIPKVGEIYAELDTFRVRLKVAKELALSAKVGALERLPDAVNVLALRQKMVLTSNASFGGLENSNRINFRHNTVIGRGKSRVNLSGSYNQESNYELSEGLLEHDSNIMGQEMTISMGLTGTSGQVFANSLDIMGFTLRTNRVIINRDPLLRASRINVFLGNRSEVLVYKGSIESGRLVYSKIHEFGDTELDTRSFPEGSYSIEISTRDGFGNKEQFVRPFTKSTRLAVRKIPVIEFDIGALRENETVYPIPVGLFSYLRRLTDSSDGKFSFYATDRAQALEADFNSEFNLLRFGVYGQVNTSFTLSKNSLGGAGMAFSFDWNNKTQSLQLDFSQSIANIETNIEDSDDEELFEAVAELGVSARESARISWGGPLRFLGYSAQLNLSGSWSRERNEEPKYDYGPNISFNMYNDGAYKVKAKLKAVYHEDEDPTINVTFNLSRNNKHWKQSELVDYRVTGPGYTSNSRTSVVFEGASSHYKDWRKRLQNTTTLNLRNIQSDYESSVALVENRINYKGELMIMDAYVTGNLEGSTGTYGGDIAGTFIWNEEGVLGAVSGSAASDGALVVVELIGEGDWKVDILLNGATKSVVYPGEIGVINVPTYQNSTVSLRPQGSDLVTIADFERTVTAYPGNIFQERFYLTKVFIIFGRLLDVNGEGMPDTRFVSPGGVSYTDEEGYFDIEAPVVLGKEFIIEPNNMFCFFKVPKLGVEEVMYEAGDVVCKPE